MIRSTLLALLLVSPAFGQALTLEEPENVLVVDGVAGAKIVGEMLLVPTGTKLAPQVAAVLPVRSEAATVTLRASDAKRQRIALSKLDSIEEGGEVVHRWLIVASGKIWIDATAIDFEKQIFDQQQIVVELGEQPDGGDDDGPDDGDDDTTPDVPDIPPDPFDNIGQRVAKWSAGKPQNANIGILYIDAAKSLLNDPTATTNSVTAKLVEEISRIAGINDYTEMRENLNADLKQRWAQSPMSRGILADYFTAIAIGLGVQP